MMILCISAWICHSSVRVCIDKNTNLFKQNVTPSYFLEGLLSGDNTVSIGNQPPQNDILPISTQLYKA